MRKVQVNSSCRSHLPRGDCSTKNSQQPSPSPQKIPRDNSSHNNSKIPSQVSKRFAFQPNLNRWQLRLSQPWKEAWTNAKRGLGTSVYDARLTFTIPSNLYGALQPPPHCGVFAAFPFIYWFLFGPRSCVDSLIPVIYHGRHKAAAAERPVSTL